MYLAEDVYSRFNIFEDLQSLLGEVKKEPLQTPLSQICLPPSPSLFWTHLPLLQFLWFFLKGSLLEINLDVSVVLIKAVLSQLMAPFNSCREFCTNCQCFCLRVNFNLLFPSLHGVYRTIGEPSKTLESSFFSYCPTISPPYDESCLNYSSLSHSGSIAE